MDQVSVQGEKKRSRKGTQGKRGCIKEGLPATSERGEKSTIRESKAGAMEIP